MFYHIAFAGFVDGEGCSVSCRVGIAHGAWLAGVASVEHGCMP